MQANTEYHYIFYTTAGCHLCDEAIAMLSHDFKDKLEQIGLCDIANEDVLIDTYGTRIPVIEALSSSQEIAWPFTKDSLSNFFKSF